MTSYSLPHQHGATPKIRAIKELLDCTQNFETVAGLFKLLGDPSRIRIFWLLCHLEECVTNLSALVEMKPPAVSHHLKALKESGLIVSRRDGKEVYYQAADTEPSRLLHVYLETMMEITCPEQEPVHARKALSETQANHVATAQEMHDYLVSHLDRHITIEELSHRFLLNGTTLKVIFREVYGNSIAAHIKEHRMQETARLLVESKRSIADIAGSVGYGSPSKLTAAFRSVYGLSPSEYRKEKKE